jgi:hypothetical protein
LIKWLTLLHQHRPINLEEREDLDVEDVEEEVETVDVEAVVEEEVDVVVVVERTTPLKDGSL